MAKRFLSNVNINDQYTLPSSDGTSGQIIQTDGAGSLSFIDNAADEARKIIFTVKNKDSISLSKGTVVHASPSATPPSGNIVEVIRADNDDSTKMPAIGILNETLAVDAEGECVVIGSVTNIATNSFTAGDTLYVSDTPGEFTNTKPTGVNNLIQKIGIVVKSHTTNGSVEVFGTFRSNDVPNAIDRNVTWTGGDLYFDNTIQARFKTNGGDIGLRIQSSGTNSFIDNEIDNLYIRQKADDKDIIFQSDDGSGGLATYFQLDGSAATHDGVNTTALYTWWGDNSRIALGASKDLEIYHDGSNSYIKDAGTGNLEIRSNFLKIKSPTAEDMIWAQENAGVNLFHNNVAKLTTTSTGVTVTGGVNASSTSTFLGNGAAAIKFGNTSTLVTMSYSGTTGVIRAESGSALQFDTNGVNTALTIDTSQNVGIGTSSPTAKLHIDSTGDALKFTRASQETYLFEHGTSGLYTKLGTTLLTGWTQDHDFKIYDNTGSQYVMFDGSTQRVGIGTTSPSYKLDVQEANGGVLARFKDTDSTHKGIVIAGDTNAGWVGNNSTVSGEGIYYQNSLNAMRLYTNSAERMRIDSSGNIGIGTTSPAAGLQVAKGGTTIPVAGSSTASAVFGNSTSDDNYGVAIGANSSGVGYISSQRTDGNATTYNLAIQPNGGNVGIGTTSPTNLLHIKKTGFTRGTFEADGDNQVGIQIIRSNSSNNTNWEIYSPSASTDLRFFNGGDRLTIDSSGNVGIGTAPSAKLDVNGNVYVRGTGSLYVNTLAGYSSGVITLNSNTNFIVPSGSVGIGTTSPDNLLTIESTGDTILQINRNDDTIGGGNRTGIIQFGAKGSWGTNLQTSKIWSYAEETFTSTANGTSLRFFTTELGAATADEKMIIDTNGNVGIGTSSPSGDLHVVGKTGTAGRIYISDIDDGASATDSVLAMKSATHAYYYNRDSGNLYLGTNDNPNMMIINSSSNVGIGTTTPTAPLHIEGGTNSEVLKIEADTNPYIRWVENGTNVGFLQFNGGSAYLSNMANGSLIFRTNNTDKMRIDSAGQIQFNEYGSGTFTGTATYRLAVDSSGDVIEIPIGGGAVDGSGAAGQVTVWTDTDTITGYTRFKVYDAGGQIQITDGTRDIRINSGYGGSTAMIGTVGSHDLGFMTANSQRVTIDSSGSVGIGTTSPENLLHIKAADGVTGVLKIEGGKSTSTSVGEINSQIDFGSNDGSVWSTGNVGGRIASVTETTNGALTGMAFYTFRQGVSSPDSLSEKLRITNDGKVGIGTSSPSYPLEVQSGGVGTVLRAGTSFISIDPTGSAAAPSLIFNGDSNTGIYRPAADTLGFSTAGSERMRIDSAGKVSVGSPVVGQLGVRGTTNDSTAYSFESANLSGNTLFAVRNDGLSFFPSGNVGIGTSSPTHLLTLETASSPSLKIKDTTQGVTFLAFSQDSNSHIGTFSAHPLVLNTNSTERMRIDSSGNVGIGTTSPSYRFTAYGSNTNSEIVASFGSANDQNEYTAIGLSGFIASNGATKAGLALKRTDTYGTGELHFLNNNTLDNSDITLSDSKMMIDASGNVGIGTTSPSNKLEVNGNIAVKTTSGNSGIKIIANNTSEVFLIMGDPDDNSMGGLAYNNSTNTLSIDCNNAERMTIDSSGQVGVGTTSPEEKLDVTGSVLISNNEFYKVENTSGTNYKIAGLTSGNEIQIGAIDYTTAGTIFAGGDNISITTGGASGTTRMKIDSSGNVGIGTSSPAQKLDVRDGDITTRDASNTNYAQLSRYTGLILKGNGSGSRGVKTPNTDALTLGTNNTERMRIDSSGNVGIGTTTPVGKLQVGAHTFTGGNGVHANSRIGSYVAGSLTSMVYASTYNDPTYPDYGMVFIHGPNTNSYNVWSISPDGPAKGDSLNFIYSANTTNIHTATPKVVFDGNGNVGIGTTSPNNNLQVKTASNGGGITIQRNSGSSGAFADLMFSISTSDAATPETKIRATRGASYDDTDISFITSNDEAMRINSSGKVGIGTTSPVTKLHIDSASFNDHITLSRSADELGISVSGGQILVEGGLSPFGNYTEDLGRSDKHWNEIYVGSVRSGAITSSGASSGRYTGLEIVNTTNAAGTETAIGLGVISAANSACDVKLVANRVAANSGSDFYIEQTNSSGTQVETFRIAEDGNATFAGKILVGTGATAAASLNAYTQTVSTNLYSALRIIENSAASSYWDIGATGGGSPDLNFYVNGGTTPKLIITGGGILKGMSHLELLNNGGSDGTATSPRLYSPASGTLAFSGNGSERMRIDSSGQVGIGTTSPSQKLEVAGNVGINGFITHNGDSGTFMGWSADDTNVFYTAGNERLRIDSSGNSTFAGNLNIESTLPRINLTDTDNNDDWSIFNNNGTYTVFNSTDAVSAFYINSDNNATFAGDVYVTGTTNSNVVISRDNMYLDAGQFYIGADDSVTDDSFRQRTASGSYFIESRKSGTWTNRLQINSAGTLIAGQGATFAGTIQSDDITIVDGTNDINLYLANTSYGIQLDYSAGDMFFRTNGGTRLTIANGGNVGIGVTSPNAKLSLAGGSNINSQNSILYIDTNSYYASGADRYITSSTAARYFQLNGEHIWSNAVSGTAGNVISFTERMRITSGGNIGIGTASPSYKLDVAGVIRATGDIIAFSDKRVKENIKTIDNSLEKVNKLRGVEFNKKGEDKKSIGVIAQEIEKILPEVVSTDDNGMKSVAYGNITGVLIEAIKELKQEIETLKTQINK